jgi:MOSC domain-containing protein YiiM
VSARVISVNVGRPAPFELAKRTIQSAIVKRPVEGPVAVRKDNLEGDEQGDKVHHGNFDQAVYAYASEDTAFWSREIDQPLGAAAFGENLTTEGLDVSGAMIGELWRIGTAELRVAGPRVPCVKLETLIGVKGFQKRFLHGLRTGAYLAIVGEGALQAGDAVEIVERPDHGVSVADALRAFLIDRSRVPELAPARPYMLPKLTRWYDEATQA